MADIKNARDLLLQAAPVRVTPVTFPPGTKIPAADVTGLGALATKDKVAAGTDVTGLGSLATKDKVPVGDVTGLGTIALKNLIDAATDVTGLGPLATKSKISASTDVTGLGPLATKTQVDATTDISNLGPLATKTKIGPADTTGFGSLATLNSVDLATTQVVGKLASGNISGLGALAALNSVDLATQVSGKLPNASVNGLGALATLSSINALNNSQITNLGSLAYASSIAAGQIGAGQLAAGVVYAGSISANQINGGTISGDRIYGGTITGVFLRVGSGSIPTGNGYAVELADSGVHAIQLNTLNIRVWGRSGYIGLFASAGDRNAVEAYSAGAMGVRGYSDSEQGVVGEAYGTGFSAHAVQGAQRPFGVSGILGSATRHGVYSAGPTYSSGGYGTFTGYHDSLCLPEDRLPIGSIVIDAERISRQGLKTIFRVALSTRPNQPNTVGVVSTKRRRLTFQPAGMSPKDYALLKDEYRLLHVNAVGEGVIRVCGEAGDLEPGDLIVTSSLPGVGMRQSDDIVRSITVARVREAVKFVTPTTTKTVACIYLAG